MILPVLAGIAIVTHIHPLYLIVHATYRQAFLQTLFEFAGITDTKSK